MGEEGEEGASVDTSIHLNMGNGTRSVEYPPHTPFSHGGSQNTTKAWYTSSNTIRANGFKDIGLHKTRAGQTTMFVASCQHTSPGNTINSTHAEAMDRLFLHTEHSFVIIRLDHEKQALKRHRVYQGAPTAPPNINQRNHLWHLVNRRRRSLLNIDHREWTSFQAVRTLEGGRRGHAVGKSEHTLSSQGNMAERGWWFWSARFRDGGLLRFSRSFDNL